MPKTVRLSLTRTGPGTFYARLTAPCGGRVALCREPVTRAEAHEWGADVIVEPCGHSNPAESCLLAAEVASVSRDLSVAEGTWVPVGELPPSPHLLDTGAGRCMTRGRCFSGCHILAAQIEPEGQGEIMGRLIHLDPDQEVRVLERRGGAHGAEPLSEPERRTCGKFVEMPDGTVGSCTLNPLHAGRCDRYPQGAAA